MKIRTLLWGILLSIFLSGCATPVKTPNPSPFPSKILTPAAVQTTSIATQTALLVMSAAPTFTPVSTSTSTSEAVTGIQRACLNVLPEIPKDSTYSGKIILYRIDISPSRKDLDYEFSFYDLNTRQIQPVQQYKTGNIVASPDRKEYALLDSNDQRIKIFSADGILLKTVPPGQYPWYIAQWLDNQHIILVIDKEQLYSWNVIIVDVFTGEQKTMPSDYPDMDKTSTMPMEDGSKTEFDSTLTRVVYPSGIARDYIGNHGAGYVLWDLVNKRKLLQIVTVINLLTPKWSPDGSKFVINGDLGEMYVVTRNGKVTQVTHLYPDPQNKTAFVSHFSSRYSWSPDGRHVALWLETLINNYQNDTATFAVLDTVTGEITDYCISAGFIEGTDLSMRYVPVWSPDGKYVVTIANEQEDGNFDTLLIDLDGNFATKINENFSPTGWLITSQK
jgi:hypothetical protein